MNFERVPSTDLREDRNRFDHLVGFRLQYETTPRLFWTENRSTKFHLTVEGMTAPQPKI